MKRFIVSMFACLLANVALAQMIGTLVNSYPTASITGQLVYVCTYNVAGQYTTVTLPYMCPVSMYFR